MQPVIDGQQLLDDLQALAHFGAAPDGGVNRIAYSAPDRQARAWLEDQMQALGMVVQTDPAGNSLAAYPGQQAELPPIGLGSHTDTVPQGGRYDGSLGVLAALACIRALHESQTILRHPLELFNFAAEEATMAGGTLGSRALIGQLDAEADLARAAWDGRPVVDHLQAAGLDPARISQARRPEGSLAAYLELHIEQGARLEAAGIPIGVVEGIVGIRRYEVVFHGYANHAGTTPMSRRQDALVSAAPFILAVREEAVAHQIVGTIGTLQLYPGAPNVIPGQVELGLEIRGLDESVLDAVETALARLAEQAGGQLTRTASKAPVVSDPRLVDALVAACEALNLSYQRLPSGAGHDAMCIAEIAPQAMLFVPSRGGVSHSPDEYTAPEDCLTGARVLLAALLRLDAILDGAE
jgi:N-carbamoyl-L-amino-acid hydrolase